MRTRFLTATAALVLGLLAQPEGSAADEVDHAILNLGTQLGWATATIELRGVDSENSSYLATVLAAAADTVRTVDREAKRVHGTSPGLEQATAGLSSLLRRASGQTAQQTTGELGSAVKDVREILDTAYGPVTGGASCKGEFLMLGFHFGQAHVGAFLTDEPYRVAAHDKVRKDLEAGLVIQRKGDRRDFNSPMVWSAWALQLSAGHSARSYTEAYRPLQVIAWTAGGRTGGPPASESPPMPPVRTGQPVPPLPPNEDDPPAGVPPPAPPDSRGFVGRWKGANIGIEIRSEGGAYNGYYTRITDNMQKNGAQVGDVGWELRLEQPGGKTFVGRVKGYGVRGPGFKWLTRFRVTLQGQSFKFQWYRSDELRIGSASYDYWKERD